MTYKFILFDLDHTLLDFDAAEEVALEQLFTELGLTDIETYKTAYRQINQQLWLDLEQGLVTKQELVETRFARTFAQFGEDRDGLELAAHYETCLGQQGQTYPGAKALLVTLKERGYQLYAATNGITAIQTNRLAQSGLAAIFDQVFISEQVGFPKPDGRFFGAIAEQVDGFTPEQALMVGDNQLADIKGASDFGLDTAFYNPNGVELKEGVRPTHVLADYDTLLALLT